MNLKIIMKHQIKENWKIKMKTYFLNVQISKNSLLDKIRIITKKHNFYFYHLIQNKKIKIKMKMNHNMQIQFKIRILILN